MSATVYCDCCKFNVKTLLTASVLATNHGTRVVELTPAYHFLVWYRISSHEAFTSKKTGELERLSSRNLYIQIGMMG